MTHCLRWLRTDRKQHTNISQPKFLLPRRAIYGTLSTVQVLRSAEFERWIESESAKIQALIESRIFRIEHYDHFGDAKHLGDGLSELRWKNGTRVVLLLHGGGKNDQKNDIKKARVLLKRYTSS